MVNLEALWQYQQKDMQVDQCESRLRQDPMRVKLLRLKNYYKEQQDAMKTVESETERVSRTLTQSQQQYETLSARVQEQASLAEQTPFETAAQVRAQLSQARDLLNRLTALEQRLGQLARDLSKGRRDLRAARQNAAKARDDYTELKTQYDQVYAQQAKELEALAKVRDEAAKDVDPALLSRYQAVKKRCATPVALLRGDQCGGCNMSQPAVVTSAVKKGERIVECETCGRILYARE